MFTTKVNAILSAIRARAAAYTAAADAIETEARAAETARIQATERIAAAVQFITDVPPGVDDNGVGQDKVFTDALDAAIGTLGVVADQPATTPEAAVSAPKASRKRGKVKSDTLHGTLTAIGTDVLIVPHGDGARIVATDGSVYDRTDTVDCLAPILSAWGLTVFHDYPSWDARPVA